MQRSRGTTSSPVASLLLPLFLLAFMLLLSASSAAAFTFQLPIGKTVCFQEEIPSNTNFELEYHVQSENGGGNSVNVVFSNVEKDTVFFYHTKATTSRYTNTLTEGDLTQVCFAAQWDRTVAGMRPTGVNPARTVSLSFLLGTALEQHRRGLTKASHAAERLKPMEAKLQLVDQLIAEAKTQYKYFKEEEGYMRNTNEYMTARVLYVSVFVIVIFVAFSAFQIYYMKRFFKKKRMID